MKNKIIAIILTAALFAGSFGSASFLAKRAVREPSKASYETAERLVVIEASDSAADVSETEVSADEGKDIVISEDASEKAGLLREQMIDRENTITIEYQSEQLPDEDTFKSYFELACAHTGQADAGDYLRRNIAAWRFEASCTGNEETHYDVSADYTVDFYTTAEQEQQIEEKIRETGWDLGLEELGEYDRLRAIYRYITANIEYDFTNLYNDDHTLKYTAYAALFDGKAVCQGFSSLFYRMTNAYGLDARIISGTAGEDAQPHAWNIVRIGNNYYHVDCTWDAGRTPDEWNYFLKCEDNFTDHHRDAEYASDNFYEKYPMAEEDYTE